MSDGVLAESGVADETLLAAILAGDAEALAALYDRYGRLAFAVALRTLGDREQAEDVVQDAFLALWRHADSFRAERGAVRTWLLTIVRNRSIDRLRGRVPTDNLDDAAPMLVAPDAAIWPTVALAELRREIAEALATLPGEQRQVVDLAYFQGLTHVEIAERTGSPLGTVKGRMRMALGKLRALLGGRLHDLEPAGEYDD